MDNNHRIRVAYLVTLAERGGAQRYVFDLATNLPSDAFSVAVAAGGTDGLIPALAARGIPASHIPHLRREIGLRRDFAAIREISGWLSAIKPHVVHLNSSKAGVLGTVAARRANVSQVVYTAHGFVFNVPLPGWQRYAYRTLERWSARGKDAIICVSEADRQSALRWKIAPAEKLITIRNGIDAGTINFHSKEKARQILSTTYHLPLTTDHIIIGTIANLYPTKGIRDFIAAAATVARNYPNAAFIAIGEGDQRPTLESAIRHHGLAGKFHLAGAIPDAVRLLPAFDMYVNASHKEGFPYALLEAMAAELPIVATAVGGVPEMMTDGKEGLLVPVGQPAALNTAIVQLMQNQPRARALGRAAGQRVRQEFTLKKMVAQTTAWYQKVLSK